MLQKFSYKMGNFYKKKFKKIIFPLGEKRENTLKKGPRRHRMLLGPPFSVPDTRVLILMKIRYAPNVQL